MQFVDPYTKGPLTLDSEGNLCSSHQGTKRTYKITDGCYDFVQPDTELTAEREHYDRHYAIVRDQNLTVDLVTREWFDEMMPWRRTLLRSLGDLRGKRILLVGNGESSKELYFHQAGAEVVFTDLSIQAVVHKMREFRGSELYRARSSGIQFHAVDAVHLPFPADYFDVVYGAAFVHHLDALDPFFHEVCYCLKAGGVCRFMDQAFSPLWEWAKRTVLKPVKLYTYRKQPRSPADIRADRRGGYKRDQLEVLMREHGFKDLLFVREWFLFRLLSRHYAKWVNYDEKKLRRLRPMLLLCQRVEARAAHTQFMQKNGLMLTWGFTK